MARAVGAVGFALVIGVIMQLIYRREEAARALFGQGASAASGWNAPPITSWFEQALNAASQAQFGAPCGYIGQGGTIPLMNMLSQGFPKAQMMVCGVLGPRSNAHGPNEFLHIDTARKVTGCVAQVLADHAAPD